MPILFNPNKKKGFFRIPVGGTQGISCAFSYSAASYTDADPDPTPTVTGTSGGTFTSTAGIVINADTGEIDLSASAVNTYVITYTVRGKACTQSVEITASFTNTYSMNFDGVDDYFTVPSFTTSGDDLTISFWFKDGGGSGSQYILSGDANNVVYHPSNTVFYAKINGTLAYIQTDSGGVPAILDGNWHHIAITKTGSTVTWWFDGGSYTTLGGGTTGGFTLLNIGAYITPSSYVDANLDELAIWNSDQTSNMATIYNSGEPGNLTSLSPLKWWRMGD